MNSKLLSAAKYTLLLVVSAALLLLAFKGISVKAIFNEILQANVFWLFLSTIVSLTALLSRAYRWKLLIEPLGYNPRLKTTTYSLMIGYFANLAFPRLGEVSRCGALSRSESIPFNKLLGTVIVERVIDVISLLFCILLAAFLEYKRLGNFINENIINPLLYRLAQLVKSPVSMTILFAVILVIIVSIVFYLKKQKTPESGIRKLMMGLVDGLRSIANLKRPWLFVFHSIFIWLLYYLGVYTCFYSLPATHGLGPSAALFLLVAGGLGMSAPVQGGIGAYHLLVSQGLMLYGLSQQDGLAFATLLHSLQMIMVVLFGVASMMLLFADRNRKINENKMVKIN